MSNAETLKQLATQLRAGPSEGKMLLENFSDNPICAVSYNPDYNCIDLTWRGYVTSVQWRYIHLSILCLLKRHGARKLFGDDRLLPNVSEDDRAWILREWMPRMIGSGLRAVGVVRAKAHWAKVSVDYVLSNAPEGLTAHTFEDVASARAWLQSIP